MIDLYDVILDFLREKRFLEKCDKMEDISHYEEVKNAHTNERGERLDRAEKILEESLKEATMYIRGNPVILRGGCRDAPYRGSGMPCRASLRQAGLHGYPGR